MEAERTVRDVFTVFREKLDGNLVQGSSFFCCHLEILKCLVLNLNFASEILVGQ